MVQLRRTNEADPSVRRETKNREIPKEHVETVWGRKTPPVWERMLMSLACLVYKPEHFKAPKHGWICGASWLVAGSSKSRTVLKPIPGTTMGSVQKVLKCRGSWEQRQS